jgi:hypothetical protein
MNNRMLFFFQKCHDFFHGLMELIRRGEEQERRWRTRHGDAADYH